MTRMDRRVTAAREFLAATVETSPDTPPADLLSCAAECRRHLVAILATPAAGALSRAQRALVLAALEEAAEARTERARGEAGCPACAESIAMDGLCAGHREHLTRADEYREAAEQIGGQR
ncbi:MAG TPA: hypothetical protein VMV92_20380 [Streptosporangiaceae bacterium]|nr:hypothetical protein [Streptosporangiaceae bacterium]